MADVEQLIHMTSGLVDGVTRLREIVLHAAVHGTLVSQDPSDEPADLLLARSRAAVVRQTQAGRAKREKPAADLEPAEQHFELPTGWSWARIVDTGQYINGLAFKPSDWKSKGRPIIRIQNLSGRNPEFNYTDGTFDPSVVVHDGDILVSWSATLDAFIWRGVEGVLNQHIFRVVPAPLVDKAYLFWLLKWVIRRMAASDHVHGLVMGHINRGPFLAFPVPIPPLAEQKRIVAKVDELMALCDRLETQLQERDARSADLAKAALARFSEAPTVENLEYLFHPSFDLPSDVVRSTVLSLAFRGLLVPQLPPSQREAGERPPRGESHQRRPELAPHTARCGNEQPKTLPYLPPGWTSSRLGEIGDWGAGATPLRGRSDYFGGSVSWFKSGELNDNTALMDSEEKVTTAALAECSFRHNSVGDVLIAMYGATIGKVAILAEGAVTNQAVCACTPSSAVFNKYLFYFLLSMRPALTAISEGGAQPNISKRKIVEFPIPVPPLEEQRRIVAKIEELMALVDQLEAQLAASEETGTKLLYALVAELAPSN
jgi:type I restriction enzyme, S subunit